MNETKSENTRFPEKESENVKFPEYWQFAILKGFKSLIYNTCLTFDDYEGKGIVEHYDEVERITDDGAQTFIIEDSQLRSVVRMSKERQRYVVPIMFEDSLPFKVKSSFPCQLKRSEKKMYHYVTGITPMNMPADRMDTTFKEFIDSFNPVEHTSEKDWTFLKILTVASKYKSVKCCICSPPATGKNSNFTILNHILQKVSRLGGPTPAKLYESLVNNDIVVIDELTSVKADHVREIESMVLAVGDNSTEYMKHSQAIGRQLKEADLMKKSIIFTYNRPDDLSKKATFFDDKWNNKYAFRSRYPQFLLKGKVETPAQVFSPGQVQEVLQESMDEIKAIAKQSSYWTQYLHKHLHNWDRSTLDLSGRHLSNLDGLLDALDVYSDTQEIYDDWLTFIKESLFAYKDMLGIAPKDQVQEKGFETKDDWIESFEKDII